MDTENEIESMIALIPATPNNHYSRYAISSSAGSSSTPTWTYDVFLSFRGEDIRRTFLGHLFHALCGKGIYTYKDDQRLEKGKSMSPELLQAIQESLFAIIIFSRDYASSTWCLFELVKIMECRKTIGQIVLPVFYEIEPSDVRKQRNSFADAFAKHEKVQSPEKVQKWREALIQAAGVSGWHSCNFPDENLVKMLDAEHYLVGVGSRVEEVISMMDLRRDEVRVVGIHGKAGIGETTIARVIFDKLSDKFDAACFLDDVGQISKKHGVDYLQEILLSEMLKLRNVKIRSTSEGMNIRMRRFRHLRVLIVLDDVDHANQLEALAGNRKWFGSGSRVTITTKDGDLLPKYGADGVHNVYGLSYDEAKQLFSLHAFGSRTPGVFRKRLVGPLCCIWRLLASLEAWASWVRGRDIAWKDIFGSLKPIGNFLFCCYDVALLTGVITFFIIVAMGLAGAFDPPDFPGFQPFPKNPKGV